MRKEYIADDSLVQRVTEDFPKYEISPDKDMKFYSYHNERLLNGQKTSTLRFANNAIRVPAEPTLDWVETTPESPRAGPTIGDILLKRVIVSTIRELTKEDLALDGYKNKQHIRQTVQDIWGVNPTLDDYVSIYTFDARKS